MLEFKYPEVLSVIHSSVQEKVCCSVDTENSLTTANDKIFTGVNSRFLGDEENSILLYSSQSGSVFTKKTNATSNAY